MMEFNKIITSIWVATAIFTCVPNVKSIYKLLKQKDSLEDMGFIRFMCLYVFIIVSFVMGCNVVYNLL